MRRGWATVWAPNKTKARTEARRLFDSVVLDDAKVEPSLGGLLDLPKNLKRTGMIAPRMSEKELVRIRANAKASGLSIRDYVVLRCCQPDA